MQDKESLDIGFTVAGDYSIGCESNRVAAMIADALSD